MPLTFAPCWNFLSSLSLVPADKFMAKSESKSLGVFGAVNVGDEACWWDYGQLRLYRTNNSLLTGVSKQASKHT